MMLKIKRISLIKTIDFGCKIPDMSLLLLSLIFIILFNNSCAKKNIIFESSNSRKTILDAIKKYKSPNWTIRYKSIRNIENFLKISDIDHEILLKENNLNFQLLETLLINASKDQHALIQIEALKGFKYLKSTNTLTRIKEITFDKSEEDNVVWHAIKVLALYKDPNSLSIFSEGLKHDDWIIREASVSGLMNLQGVVEDNKLYPSIRLANEDSNVSVRIALLENLTVKSQDIYLSIINRFNIERSKKVNTSLLRASLKALKGYRLDLRTREKVIELLGHRDKKIRVLALRVLKFEKLITE